MTMTMNEKQDSVHSLIHETFVLGSWTVQPMLNRIELLESAGVSESPDGPHIRNLEPRLMQLLCFLANNAERVSTREELVKALWPKVIVNENSLTRAVSELRKQLATTELSGNSYIETIPKKGYRLSPSVLVRRGALLAPAACAEESDPAQTAAKTRQQEHRSPPWPLPESAGLAALAQRPASTLRSNWALFASAASLSLVLGLWAMLYGFAPGDVSPQPAAFLVDQVIDEIEPWVAAELTMSSDSRGGRVENKMLSGPVFSDDSKTFAYIQCSNEGSTIFIGSSQRAPQGQLGEIGTDQTEAPAIAVFSSTAMLENLRWSPLGNALLFARPAKLSNAALYSGASAVMSPGSELVMLDLDTLEARVIYRIESEEGDEINEAMSLT